MHIPAATEPVLWGAAGGAVLLALAGFGWAGWTTAGSAEAMAASRADEAVVAALAPVCVDHFERDRAAVANRAALRAAFSLERGAIVERGGWASIGSDSTDVRRAAVARACAALLVPDD